MSLNSFNSRQYYFLQARQLVLIVTSFCVAVALTSCTTVTTEQYEATVQTTFTWQVKYTIDPANDKQPRFEEFASNSLKSRNGEKPQDAVIGPDDKGLWWSALPPRHSIDEVEQRSKPPEQPTRPELLRMEKYQITYQQNGQTVTLPTNYDVYRQVARAYRSRKPLQLTLGINNGSVTKAEPLGN